MEKYWIAGTDPPSLYHIKGDWEKNLEHELKASGDHKHPRWNNAWDGKIDLILNLTICTLLFCSLQ